MPGEHGETGLKQKLDRDVSGFRHLWLRAWARVDYADLYFFYLICKTLYISFDGPYGSGGDSTPVGAALMKL
jgi:hypothetical protein